MNDTIVPAPVCLFAYKRPDTLRATVTSLLENDLAAGTDIYIFSDAAANERDSESVKAVRDFIDTINGFRSITIFLAETNKGLASSIIDGVSKVIGLTGKVIVLEDDLVVTPNFLCFMNQALSFYTTNQQVFSVAGYTSPVKESGSGDMYFTRRASSWGWATWKDRWEKIDWSVADFHSFDKNAKRQREFNEMGSDLTDMLRKQMHGRINSWAIRWVYHQFKYNLLTVYPRVSKVTNIGFHTEATHTDVNNRTRFATTTDQSGKMEFNFSKELFLDKNIIRQFVAPYSLSTRIRYKIKGIFNS